MLSDKPWRIEAVMFLFAGVMAGISFGMLGALGVGAVWSDLKPAELQFYRFLPGVVGYHLLPLVLVTFFLRQHGLTWREFLGLHRPQVRAMIVRAVIVALLAVPVALTLNQLSAHLLTILRDKPPELQPSMKVLEISYSIGKRIVFTFAAVVLAPITEEVLFRGVFYATVKEMGLPRLGLFGTSFLFAAIHGSEMVMVPLFFFSVVLTLLYERTQGLLAPIVAHACFNAVNIVAYMLMHRGGG